MAKTDAIQLFQDKQVRSIWDDEKEEWYFSVVDVVAVLTDSDNPRRYWSDLKRKLSFEGSHVYEKIVQLKLAALDGKKRLTDVADTQQLLRIIQSIPSPNAEPFKLWLAEVGARRLEQLQDPEQSIQQALLDYRRLGYTEDWINQRLKSIEIRKDLTDQWQAHKVKENQYGLLTNTIYKAWAGKTSKEYRKFKGLKKENLRDNMTNAELVFNMLAELAATNITIAKNPQTFQQNNDCAQEGGNVAAVARRELEAKTGRKIVSPLNAKDFRTQLIKQDTACQASNTTKN